MQNRFKHTALGALLLVMAMFVVLPATTIWLADPCHVFHRPLGGIFQHGFSDNPRCQNAGLITSYLPTPDEQFDSVLTGTSLSWNFTGEALAAHSGMRRTLKLILPGASPVEQHVMMQKVLATGTVRRIFWELFPQQYLFHAGDKLARVTHDDTFPAYLYNNSVLDDYRYLFSKSSLAGSLGVLAGAPAFNVPTIDLISHWDDGCPRARDCSPIHTVEDIANLRAEYRKPARQWRAPADRQHLDFSGIDTWLLRTVLAHCNSQVQFDLYVPPLSYWWFAIQGPYEFDFQLYALRHVLERTASCHNVRVFAFNDEAWIAGDLAHYRDPRHFMGDIHHYIMDSLGHGKHVITTSTIDRYEQRFIAAVNDYEPWASTQEEMQRNGRY